MSGIGIMSATTLANSGGASARAPYPISYVIIGGGGSGVSYVNTGRANKSGGGGAGGVLQGSISSSCLVLCTVYPVTVGAGGTSNPSGGTATCPPSIPAPWRGYPTAKAVGNSGSPSTFGPLVAYGGGTGGICSGSPGGSGGGGGYSSGGSGTCGQGYPGGTGAKNPPTIYYCGGGTSGGGGGAGSAGTTLHCMTFPPKIPTGYTPRYYGGYAGNGGSGITISITGTPFIVGGGGGAGGFSFSCTTPKPPSTYTGFMRFRSGGLSGSGGGGYGGISVCSPNQPTIALTYPARCCLLTMWCVWREGAQPVAGAYPGSPAWPNVTPWFYGCPGATGTGGGGGAGAVVETCTTGTIFAGGNGGPGAVYIAVPKVSGALGVATGYCTTGTTACKIWYKWTSSGSFKA